MATLRLFLFPSAIALLFFFLVLSGTKTAAASAGRGMMELPNVKKNIKVQKLGRTTVDHANDVTIAHFLLIQGTAPPENMLLDFDRVVKAKSWMRKTGGMKLNLSIEARRRGELTKKVYNANIMAYSNSISLLSWKPYPWEE